MKLLWTKSNNIGSKLIEWGTGGDCSHFAVVFDDRPGGYGILFHSHITGAGLDYFGSFTEKNQIVHAMEPKYPLNEEAVYQALVSRFNHRPYDRLAYLYFGVRVFMLKFFGVPLPQRNRWGDRDALLCTEVAQALSESGVIGLPDLKDYAIISPQSLYNIVTSSCPLWVPYEPRPESNLPIDGHKSEGK